MESLGTLLLVLLWFVGVPLLAFGVLKATGYDWNKPWLKWRGEYGPLPLRVYLGGSSPSWDWACSSRP